MTLAPLGGKKSLTKCAHFNLYHFNFVSSWGLSLKLRLNILKPSLNVGCINKKLDRSFYRCLGPTNDIIKCIFQKWFLRRWAIFTCGQKCYRSDFFFHRWFFQKWLRMHEKILIISWSTFCASEWVLASAWLELKIS